MGRNDFRHFHQKHRRHQQRSTVLQSLTGLCSLGAFRSSWGGGNETKDIRSQDTSVPKTPEGKVPSLQLTRCSTACAILQPAFAGPWLQASQWDCGVQKPMKHGIVWATQTQRFVPPSLCGTAFGKYLAGSPKRGLGPLCPISNNPVLGRQAGALAWKSHAH